MADIDLAKAYQDMADLMTEAGLAGEAYCVTIAVWNHQRTPHPAVYYTLTALKGTTVRAQVEGRTLELAFSAMRGALGLETTDLGTVVLPAQNA